jgi:hypothetical protein
MRTYWYGDGQVLRVPLSAMPAVDAATMGALPAFAAGMGFPSLLDRSEHADDGEGVLVFGPPEGQPPPSPPGREDLDAESVVIWLRQHTVTALLFAKTLADLATILAMIATYEHSIGQISAQGEQALQRRVELAQEVQTRTIVTPVADWPETVLQWPER